jgi:hypothetical protein
LPAADAPFNAWSGAWLEPQFVAQPRDEPAIGLLARVARQRAPASPCKAQRRFVELVGFQQLCRQRDARRINTPAAAAAQQPTPRAGDRAESEPADPRLLPSSSKSVSRSPR